MVFWECPIKRCLFIDCRFCSAIAQAQSLWMENIWVELNLLLQIIFLGLCLYFHSSVYILWFNPCGTGCIFDTIFNWKRKIGPNLIFVVKQVFYKDCPVFSSIYPPYKWIQGISCINRRPLHTIILQPACHAFSWGLCIQGDMHFTR